MGFLMENGSYAYRREDGRWRRYNVSHGLQLTASFEKGLRFHKAGTSFWCRCCEKTKMKGTRYLCKEYEKICVDCAMEWINESEKTFNKIKQMLYERREELSINKNKWRKEQILGAIEGGN